MKFSDLAFGEMGLNRSVTKNTAMAPNIDLSTIYSCRYLTYHSPTASRHGSAKCTTAGRTVHLSLFKQQLCLFWRLVWMAQIGAWLKSPLTIISSPYRLVASTADGLLL